MRILIPNATGPKNVGDEAILLSLLAVLHEQFPDAHVTIHSYHPELHDAGQANVFRYHLYAWTAFEDRRLLVRLFRLARLLIAYALLCVGVYPPRFVTGPTLATLLEDYQKADLFVFTSGSYLRTKGGITQIINLGMHALMIRFAQSFSKKVVVMPMSFGPFAKSWHRAFAAWALHDVHHAFIREKKSLTTLDPKGVMKNVSLVPDMALYLQSTAHVPKATPPMIGFTVRNWFDEKEQAMFESTLGEALTIVAKNHSLRIQPIVQVDAGEYGEDDMAATKRVTEVIRRQYDRVEPIKNITTVEQGIQTYAALEFLVGTRMHSLILAAVATTPFLGIAYEYKTVGLMDILGLPEAVVDIKDARTNPQALAGHIEAECKRRAELATHIANKLNEIRANSIAALKASLSS